MGRLSQEFEQGIERFLGRDGRHVVSTNSCTEALHISARLIGLGPGDEVICPSLHLRRRAPGHQPHGRRRRLLRRRDRSPGHRSGAGARADHPRTEPSWPSTTSGLPCRLDELRASPREHGLRVIEDAAHAFGSFSAGRRVGSFGDITCFSFGPVKTITTLEGGAVVTPTERHAGAARTAAPRHRLRHRRPLPQPAELGIRRGAPGLPVPLGSVPAAIGLAQLGDGRRVHQQPAELLPRTTTRPSPTSPASSCSTPTGRTSPRTSTSSASGDGARRRVSSSISSTRESRPGSTSSARTVHVLCRVQAGRPVGDRSLLPARC